MTIPMLVFAALLWHDWLGLGLALSLFNGESFIGYWMKHDIPFAGAIGIAIACSTFDITMWFRLFFWIRDAYGHGRAVYDELREQVDFDRLNGERNWLRVVQLRGMQLYLAYVPQPREYPHSDDPYLTQFRHYAWLVFYGFTPTCILPGVGYVVAFHLNPWIAFPIIAGANALKMTVFGFLALHIPWQVIAAIVVIVVPRIRKVIERQNRISIAKSATHP